MTHYLLSPLRSPGKKIKFDVSWILHSLIPRYAKICQGFEVPKKSGIFKELPSRWPDLCHDTVVERIIRGREEYLTRNKDRARREDFGDYG